MFRLEKVFQNDDSGYLIFINFIKSIILFLSIYIFAILKENSIFELVDFKIFKNSNLYYFSIFFYYFIIYLLFFFIIKEFTKETF